ncbi:MAG: hypothetical protein GY853_13720 [PVC group bacterium]|nr:hypothetical protein [PVC group bacterium]
MTKYYHLIYNYEAYDDDWTKETCIDIHPSIWIIKKETAAIGTGKDYIIKKYSEIDKETYEERIKQEKIYDEKLENHRQKMSAKEKNKPKKKWWF